jgi:hypothetical protein
VAYAGSGAQRSLKEHICNELQGVKRTAAPIMQSEIIINGVAERGHDAAQQPKSDVYDEQIFRRRRQAKKISGISIIDKHSAKLTKKSGFIPPLTRFYHIRQHFLRFNPKKRLDNLLFLWESCIFAQLFFKSQITDYEQNRIS